MGSSGVHVFVAFFGREDEALGYTQEQWQPEPGVDATWEEYEAWDERSPSWQMQEDMGCVHLDSDFVETVWGTAEGHHGIDWGYLASVIGSDSAVACERAASVGETTLILIYEEASDGSSFRFASTPRMTHCGLYASRS